MEVVTLLLFIGVFWVIFGLGFFAWNLLATHHEHTERMALLPLEDNWTDPQTHAHRKEEGTQP